MRRFMLSIGALAILAGPSQAEVNPDVETTLKVFMRDAVDFVQAADNTLAIFKERYPNVSVDIRYNNPSAGTWASFANKYLNQYSAGDGADVVDVAIEGFETIASKGILANLDPLIAESEELQQVVADINPNLLDAMRSPSTGELNYFPTQWNNVVTYYNKSLFDEAGIDYPQDGWTWNEFVEAGKALTTEGSDGKMATWGYMIPGNSNFVMSPWFYTNNTDKLTPDWKASNAKDPAFSESLQFLHSLIHEHGISPTYEDKIGLEEFIAGQVAMFSCGHWCVPPIKAAGIDAGIVMPPIPTEGGEQITVFGIGGMGVKDDSPNKELALEWVRLFAGESFQKTTSESLYSIPSSDKWANTDEFLAFPDNAAIFYGSADNVRAVSSPSNFRQVEDIFLRNISNYLTDNATLEDTVSDMDSELVRAMRRAR